jgi:acyl carrier protein
MRSTEGFDERVRHVMADVLDLDPDRIDASTAMESVESWDSLTHINMCLALEQEFQVSFDVAEMESMLSYGDVLQVLQAKL